LASHPVKTCAETKVHAQIAAPELVSQWHQALVPLSFAIVAKRLHNKNGVRSLQASWKNHTTIDDFSIPL